MFYEIKDTTLINELPLYISQLDMQLKVVWANKQAHEQVDDIEGQQCYFGFNPDQEQCTFCPCVRALSSKNKEVSLVEITTEDGKERVYEITGVPVFDEANNLSGVYEIRRDVTLQLEEKLPQVEMKQSSKKQKEEIFSPDRLLDIVSNEMREHLDLAMRMHSRINTRKISQELKMNLAGMRSALMKSQNVLNNISTMRNINKGIIKQSKKKVDLKKLVISKFSDYQNKAVINGNTFDYKYDSTIHGKLVMDKRKMELTLSNLIDYCITNTTNRFIHLTVTLVEEDVESVKVSFRIKNAGSIDINDQVQKDEDNFIRNNLTLSVIRHLTNLQKGSMRIIPMSGYGIDIELMLTFKKPFATAKLPFFNHIRDEIKNTKEKILSSETVIRKKILIAEDEPIGRITMEQMLKNDYDVILAKNGKVAVEKYFEEEPDLVIMDIMMPIMNGFDAFDQIERNCIKRVPIIACTAKVISSEKEYLTSYGFDDYISKPVTMKQLRELIKQHLNER